jgi:hypothetical protein
MFDAHPVLWYVSLLCTLSWAFWKIVARIYSKHPLDNIPGPLPESYLWGPFDLDLGLIDIC